MKYAIILYEARTPKSKLITLRDPSVHYILLASSASHKYFGEQNLSLFEQIHILDKLQLSNTLPLLQQYYTQSDSQNFFILTSDEACVYLAAQLREALHLPGVTTDEILPFVDKITMKKKLANTKINYPHYLKVDKSEAIKNSTGYSQKILSTLKFPLIAKPVSHYSSTGVYKLLNANDLSEWLMHLSQNPIEYELEEFIEGTLFECDALINDKQVKYFVCSEYSVPCMDFGRGKILGALELLPSDPRWTLLEHFNQDVIKALQPPDGVTHLEAFITPTTEIIFLEIAARPPGALVCETHEKNTSINLEILHFKIQLNLPISLKIDSSQAYNSWAYLPKFGGRVKKLLQPDFDSEYQIHWNVKTGDVLLPSRDFASRDQIAGFLTFHNKNYEALRQDFYKLKKYKVMEISK